MVLYPPEELNEKFLIRLRDCVIKLPENHPLKRWLKWIAKSIPLNTHEQKVQSALREIIQSRFNLITDQKMRNEIINIIDEIPRDTLAEELLRSYLYLMIGNITHSDNILREIMRMPPERNWRRHKRRPSLFHKVASDHIGELISKMMNHPTDRRILELFGLYLDHFYNDEPTRKLVSQIDSNEIESKLSLKYTEGMAPLFVQYLRFSMMGENRRFRLLRDIKRFPYSMQAYWVWPFINITPLISESMLSELKLIENQNELWFIYLMENEKMADLYSRKVGKSFLPGRRSFLKSNLSDEKKIMMSLYKLIELGDIGPELIQTTVHFLTNE